MASLTCVDFHVTTLEESTAHCVIVFVFGLTYLGSDLVYSTTVKMRGEDMFWSVPHTQDRKYTKIFVVNINK